MKKQLTEYEEQCCVIDWVDRHINEYPDLRMLMVGLEGIRLPIGLAMKAKRAGMRKGFPDLHLPVSRKHGGRVFHSMFIEMKVKGGVLSSDQIIMMDLLEDADNYVLLCVGAVATVQAIKDYLR